MRLKEKSCLFNLHPGYFISYMFKKMGFFIQNVEDMIDGLKELEIIEISQFKRSTFG